MSRELQTSTSISAPVPAVVGTSQTGGKASSLGGLFIAVTLFLPKGIVGTLAPRFSKKPGPDARERIEHSEDAEAGIDGIAEEPAR